MNIAVLLEPLNGPPPAVQYRWDADTDILTATLGDGASGAGASGTVELEGDDGSWVVLDIVAGCMRGVEIAVWPDVSRQPLLTAPEPSSVVHARVTVPVPASGAPLATLEVNTQLAAEADDAERLIHLQVGAGRGTRTVRVGRDLLLDIDQQDNLAGLWLLNVPPFPSPDPIS